MLPPRFGLSARAVLAAAVLLVIAGCGGDTEPTYSEQPVEDLYHQAMDALQSRNYEVAAARFNEVDRQHPYSVWATRAQLMSAYAEYADNRYDEAILALDRFINLHPGNKDVPYAFYLKGLIYYEQISDVVRDQRKAEQALDSFEELVRRFPESKYAREARLKIDVALDQLAGKEMEIGRFYQKQGEYLAAINRFRAVIEKYQTTVHTPEALHRIVESYLSLGVIEEARIASAVLGHNYPGSAWYGDSYALLQQAGVTPATRGELSAPDPERRRSWLDSLWESLF